MDGVVGTGMGFSGVQSDSLCIHVRRCFYMSLTDAFHFRCNGIVSTYQKYKVEFSGIGAGPEGTAESIGCASQMAVFRWKSRSGYLRLKDKRSKAVRAKLANNPKYVYQHMQGEIATDENSGEHEHPYKFVRWLTL